MRVSDIKIGEFYRVKDNDYAWAKVVQIIPPMTPPNNTRATVVKCEWVVNNNDKFGLIKYFKVSNLVEGKKGGEQE